MNRTTVRKADRSGLWFGVIVFGLFGQIAWVIENMYLNVYLYKTITYDLNATSAMVAASAVAATLTTLFMGVLSDKVGRRKLFMSLGYIIWGFTVMAFSAVTVDNAAAAGAKNPIAAATVLIVVLDCVMTFFGSTANDAAFNAWVTDNTTDKNRGRVEGVLQIMPLLALLVVFGALDGLTKAGNWTVFYVVVGSVTSLSGVLGLFFIRDSKALKPKTGAYFKDIFHGFRPSTVKQNGILYIIFLAMCLVGIGNNVYMPYLMIYIEYFLGYADYVLLLGGVILGASAISVLFGLIADKVDKRILFAPAFLLYIAGGTGMIFARSMVAVGIAGFALMAGNLSIGVLLASLVRIHTPEKEVGLFQGIRMVFTVLIPMCVGPFIGAFVSSTSNAVYVDPTTLQEQPVPSNLIFLAAVVVTVLAIAPVLFMTLYKKGFLWNKGVTPQTAEEPTGVPAESGGTPIAESGSDPESEAAENAERAETPVIAERAEIPKNDARTETAKNAETSESWESPNASKTRETQKAPKSRRTTYEPKPQRTRRHRNPCNLRTRRKPGNRRTRRKSGERRTNRTAETSESWESPNASKPRKTQKAPKPRRTTDEPKPRRTRRHRIPGISEGAETAKNDVRTETSEKRIETDFAEETR